MTALLIMFILFIGLLLSGLPILPPSGFLLYPTFWPPVMYR